MSGTISKTTFVYTVLHRTDEPFGTLEDALSEAYDGHAVGAVTFDETKMLADEDVPDELRTLGNDGEFFDNDLDPEGP